MRHHQRTWDSPLAFIRQEYRRPERAASSRTPAVGGKLAMGPTLATGRALALGFQAFLEFSRQLDEAGCQADIFVDRISMVIA